MIAISIIGSTPIVTGQLRNLLLEIRPGLFVGHLPGKAFVEIWDTICAAGRGTAVAAIPCRNEIGVRVLYFGSNARELADYDGLQLVISPPTMGRGKEEEV